MEHEWYSHKIKEITSELLNEPIEYMIEILNEMRQELHEVSPFNAEPVDFIKWVSNELVYANDYNPNRVAPPEMKLLEHSVLMDGYTQPIVTWPQPDNRAEVIDGFHRLRIGKECDSVKSRVHGYLPTVLIKGDRTDKNDRIASTIRHNRARGKHQIDAMSDIILELKNRNWKNERIARELGMDEEEILRLCQITGLGELFKDDDFSRAWESSDSIEWFEPLDDSAEIEGEYRTVNTSDPQRIFHTFDEWECYKAGFYATAVNGKTQEECEREYAEFLRDESKFALSCERVISEWKNSCEHYLTNVAMNRIAWMGQAAACISEGLPSKYCAGYNLLSDEEKDIANNTALKFINKWMIANGRPPLAMKDAIAEGRQVNIY